MARRHQRRSYIPQQPRRFQPSRRTCHRPIPTSPWSPPSRRPRNPRLPRGARITLLASSADRTDAPADRRELTFAEISHRQNFRRQRLPPERARISLFGRHGSPSWPWRMLLRERAPAVRSPTAGASFWPTNRRPPRHSIGFRAPIDQRPVPGGKFFSANFEPWRPLGRLIGQGKGSQS